MRREEVEGEQRGGWERLHRGGREKKEEYKHDKGVREAKEVQTLLCRKKLPSNPSCLWQPLKKINSHSCEEKKIQSILCLPDFSAPEISYPLWDLGILSLR